MPGIPVLVLEISQDIRYIPSKKCRSRFARGKNNAIKIEEKET